MFITDVGKVILVIGEKQLSFRIKMFWKYSCYVWVYT